MAINGLGSFDMMSTYNRINVKDQAISAAAPIASAEVNVNEAIKDAPKEEKSELKVNLNFEGMRARTSFNLDDVTRDFAKRSSFSMTRVDDQQMRTDMQKAVSDMEKDQTIQQYQYFVGDNNVILNDEDGVVIMK